MAEGPAVRDLGVLVLEPYYGGSHRHFLDGLRQHLPFTFEFMTLPARKWKWRMRLAAPWFAGKLHESGRRYDRILCSTFVDVAAFRGLAPQWVREVPLLTYFHENQFAYPVQVKDERDFHFALTNVTTALASDSLAFNSRYNLSSFLEGIRDLLKLSHDLRLDDPCGEIHSKSVILPPAIDFSVIDSEETPAAGGRPLVLWNHRWEHDKNPEQFFDALFRLADEGLDFGLVMIGETFRECPPVFDEARRRLADRIVYCGYLHDRREYARWLRRSTIVVSTALHEFFGIAMMESVRAGCRPLLPRRLSYPGLFPDEYLYDDTEFIDRLRTLILSGTRLSPEEAKELTEPYSWAALAPAFAEWIAGGGMPGDSTLPVHSLPVGEN